MTSFNRNICNVVQCKPNHIFCSSLINDLHVLVSSPVILQRHSLTEMQCRLEFFLACIFFFKYTFPHRSCLFYFHWNNASILCSFVYNSFQYFLEGWKLCLFVFACCVPHLHIVGSVLKNEWRVCGDKWFIFTPYKIAFDLAVLYLIVLHMWLPS